MCHSRDEEDWAGTSFREQVESAFLFNRIDFRVFLR